MILKDIGDSPENSPVSISSLLSSAGIGRPVRNSQLDKTKNRREQMIQAMEDRGVDFTKIADSLYDSMDDDKTRLQATRLAAEIHNLLSDKERQQPTTINVVIADPGNRNLIELIMPVERTE